MAENTRKLTNRPEVFNENPQEWEYMPEASKPNMGTENPQFAPGATEFTSAEGARPEGAPPPLPERPEMTPPDPRLGMNPQGEWDTDKMQRMFPEMFVQPETWLDPTEEAKRREGMPYDKTKRYDPNKPVEGMGIQGGRVPPPRPSRDEFEKIVFDQIGGNPFGMNPYDAVVQSDKELPELFNHVFAGRAIYLDLPKLSKDERAYWEQIKKQHHERVYKQALSQKQGMLEQYKWMMGKYDMDTKQQQADFAAQEKERIRQEAIKNKAPIMRAVYNAEGVQTVHAFYPDGRIVDTGKRTGMYSLEDAMPPNVKQAQQLINKFSPQANPMTMMMITMMKDKDPKTAAMFEQMLNPQVPPEMKDAVEASRQLVNEYWRQFGAKFKKEGGQPGAPQAQPQQGPAAPQPGGQPAQPVGAPSSPNPEEVVAKIVTGIKSGKSMDKSIQAFARLYQNNPKALNRLRAAMEKVGAPLPENFLYEQSGQQGVSENKRVKK
jgi:hypothetical protein